LLALKNRNLLRSREQIAYGCGSRKKRITEEIKETTKNHLHKDHEQKKNVFGREEKVGEEFLYAFFVLVQYP